MGGREGGGYMYIYIHTEREREGERERERERERTRERGTGGLPGQENPRRARRGRRPLPRPALELRVRGVFRSGSGTENTGNEDAGSRCRSRN